MLAHTHETQHTPCPTDFASFWTHRIHEVDAHGLRYKLEECPQFSHAQLNTYHLWFDGLYGEELHAKYLCVPNARATVLQFHGYPGASRSFFEQAGFAAAGFNVIALDNPGQGGPSQDHAHYRGTTVAGHIVAGSKGAVQDQYYVHLYQSVRLVTRIAHELHPLVPLYANGASQGGALALACAALSPLLIKKAGVLYPFLSDMAQVFEIDADQQAYEELRYVERWFDPTAASRQQLVEHLAYIDAANMATLVRCPVLFGTGLLDTVVPPTTQDYTYEQLSCTKRRLIYPHSAHEEIAHFDDTVLRWFNGGDLYAL